MQGVGFRWYVRETATTLGLAGWVRNLTDGAVEVSAVGEPALIEALRERLAAGPRHARVARVVDLADGAAPAGATFEILRDPRG